MEKNSVYKEQYIPQIIRSGKITTLMGLIISLLPGIVLTFVFDIKIPKSAFFASAFTMISMSAPNYIIHPVAFFPMLGVPGTYLTFLSGNVTNMRIPCAMAAQKAAEVELGTERGTVIATIGIAVSIIINVAILTVGVILGTSVLSNMPQNFIDMLNLILPAIFGAIFAETFVENKLAGVLSLAVALLTLYLSKIGIIPSFLTVLICMGCTMFILKMLHKPQSDQGDN